MDGSAQLSPFSLSSILLGMVLGTISSILATLLYNLSTSRVKTWRGRSSARRANKRIKELEKNLEDFESFKNNHPRFYAILFRYIFIVVLFFSLSITFIALTYIIYYFTPSQYNLLSVVTSLSFSSFFSFITLRVILDAISIAEMFVFDDYDIYRKKIIEDLKGIAQQAPPAATK